MQRFNIGCEARHRAMGDARVLYEFVDLLERRHDTTHVDNAIKQQLKSPSLPVNITDQDIEKLPAFEGSVAMVSQSTMFTHEFKKLTAKLAEIYPELVVFDTICGATKERQSDLVELVNEGAEAIVVIGGKHSANTRKLAKLAASHNRPTFHVETAEDLKPDELSSFSMVGVTAGASTPEFIIRSVCERLEAI